MLRCPTVGGARAGQVIYSSNRKRTNTSRGNYSKGGLHGVPLNSQMRIRMYPPSGAHPHAQPAGHRITLLPPLTAASHTAFDEYVLWEILL